MSSRFSIVRKGYDPVEVDEYLDSVREHLTRLDTMYKNSLQEIDNMSSALASYKQKDKEYKNNLQEIESLKNALENYRQKETAINNAIVNSQVSADNILQNAKSKADSIVRAAKKEAAEAKESFGRLLNDVIVSMDPHRKAVENFRRDYQVLLSKYLREFDESEFGDVADRLDALEDLLVTLRDNG